MRKIFISVSSVLLVCILATAIFAWNRLSDYSRVLSANWEFTIPSGAAYSEIYAEDEGVSSHGDGVRYHVFSYKNDEPIDEMCEWQSAEGNTKFNERYSSAAEKWLDRLGVSSEKRPNYGECLYWYSSHRDNSEIIVFRDKSKGRIYTVESFL